MRDNHSVPYILKPHITGHDSVIMHRLTNEISSDTEAAADYTLYTADHSLHASSRLTPSLLDQCCTTHSHRCLNVSTMSSAKWICHEASRHVPTSWHVLPLPFHFASGVITTFLSTTKKTVIRECSSHGRYVMRPSRLGACGICKEELTNHYY